MATYDFSLLYGQYPAVISQMPEVFTSHQFILKLAEENQVQYIEALYSYRDNLRNSHPAPFMMVHGILAQHLFAYPELIQQTRPAVNSIDIFGNHNSASEWRKVP